MKEYIKEHKTFAAIFIMVVGALIVIIGNSLASTDTGLLRDQTVDGIVFSNAKLEYKGSISTYTVDVTNTNESLYDLKYVKIKISLANDKEYDLIGYVGENIPSSVTRSITAEINWDLTTANSIEYIIIK